MEDKIKNLTIDEVLFWIIKNSDDTDVMDKINKMTFQFTSKYSKWSDNGGNYA